MCAETGKWHTRRFPQVKPLQNDLFLHVFSVTIIIEETFAIYTRIRRGQCRGSTFYSINRALTWPRERLRAVHGHLYVNICMYKVQRFKFVRLGAFGL